MEPTNQPDAMYFCQTCGIRYELNEAGEKQFYWSHRNLPTTKEQVANRVCSYLKTSDKIEGCANKSSVSSFAREWTGEFVVE